MVGGTVVGRDAGHSVRQLKLRLRWSYRWRGLNGFGAAGGSFSCWVARQVGRRQHFVQASALWARLDWRDLDVGRPH